MSDTSINLKSKVINAAKWSTITEILSKLISPITNMILARILLPEAFGVVATVIMIVSFAEMFANSGFQKYLVQHEFESEDEKNKNANVAFWTNLGISIIMWALIVMYSERIAVLVGNPGLGLVIAIACVQIPITALSSIQMALYRRDFDFKTLFIVRMISIVVPFFVTIPLAIAGFTYWSLIIGTLVMHFLNACILTVKSKWKPTFYYNLKIIKQMLSFSLWSLMEAISIWSTSWIDVFIISSLLSSYYLGLYKTSTTMISGIMTLITAAIVPILFSALSRLQNDAEHFNKLFLKVQRIVSILVFPLGVGVYLFSDLATQILLGNQWTEASDIVGIWALTSSIMIVLGHFCSEVYRAKGRPKLSFVAQLLHLIVLVPTCIISVKYGFWVLIFARSWIRIQFVLVHLIIMEKAIGISVFKTLKNVLPSAISSTTMGIVGFFLVKFSEDLLWNLVSILICILTYFSVLFIFPRIRAEIIGFVLKLLPSRYYKKQLQ